MNGLIKLSDHAPCYSSCKASRLRPGLGDTCSGHPLPPGLGAPAAVGSAPNPSEKSIFIGAGAVPGILPERAQVHALLGGGTRARPPGSLPGALPPLRGAARRVRPRHGAGLLSPFAHPHRTHSPRRPRALQRAPGRACPQGGVARLSFSPSLPHRAWHQEGPHLSVEGTNDPTFWAEVQIWEMSRAHHGIPGPEVRRKLSGHLCHPVPACTSRLVGSGLCLGAAPSLSIPPSAAS